jgi:hypothetical protein
MMALTLKERDGEPKFAYRLLVLTLVIDSVARGIAALEYLQSPHDRLRVGFDPNESPPRSVLLHGLANHCFVAPAQGATCGFVFYVAVKLWATLQLAAQMQGVALIGHKLSWIAYALTERRHHYKLCQSGQNSL